MLLKYLDMKHPDYCPDRWDMISALSEGGKRFHAEPTLSKMLPKNQFEPDSMWHLRKEQAHYYSYMGSIVNLYVAWLFAQQPSVKPYQKGTTTLIKGVDSVYEQLQSDVGNETKFVDFVKERFRSSLKTGKSFWLLEKPYSEEDTAKMSAQQYEDKGLNRFFLKELVRESITDWQCNDKGEFVWVLTWDKTQDRMGLGGGRDQIVETWRYYTATNVEIFELKYEVGKRPQGETFEIQGQEFPHGFKRVPIVCMGLPHELCIGEQTYDPQLEHFRLDSGLSWLIRRTAYAMPVIKSDDETVLKQTFGAGYALRLGEKDDMSWASPDPSSFDTIRKAKEGKRDEIYRIVHQMAQGLDNNAETVGRSADSKEIDAAATRILLGEYGRIVSHSIEETFEIISEARGDTTYKWVVEGFTGYDTATVGSLLANAALAKEVGIPSQTFTAELYTKAAHALLPELEQAIKDKIQKEIHSAKFDVESLNPTRAKVKLDLAKAKEAVAKAGQARATAKVTRSGQTTDAPVSKPKK